MQKITPRLEDSAKNFYVLNFKSLHAGAEQILNSAPNLYIRTLSKLKGCFSEKELKAIIQALDVRLDHEEAGLQILHKISNSLELDENSKQFLLSKLENLHIWDRAIIEIWAANFWKKKISSNADIDGYISELA